MLVETRVQAAKMEEKIIAMLAKMDEKMDARNKEMKEENMNGRMNV